MFKINLSHLSIDDLCTYHKNCSAYDFEILNGVKKNMKGSMKSRKKRRKGRRRKTRKI